MAASGALKIIVGMLAAMKTIDLVNVWVRTSSEPPPVRLISASEYEKLDESVQITGEALGEIGRRMMYNYREVHEPPPPKDARGIFTLIGRDVGMGCSEGKVEVPERRVCWSCGKRHVFTSKYP